MKRRYWWGIGILVLGVVVWGGFRIYQNQQTSLDYITEEQQDALESGLTLRDVTLEQQDEDGQLLWRVYADEVTYSPDQRSANLTRPEGEFYQDGQLHYRAKADKGTILEDGQTIFLEQNIVATGIQNEMILSGEMLEWHPDENLMTLRNGVTGVHPQVRAKAQEARVYNQEGRMELVGQVVATTVVEDPEQDPWLKLQGEVLEWRWEEEEISSEQAIRVERFQNQKITEVLTGDRGFVELPENRVSVTDNVNVQIAEIPLEMRSDDAVWDVDEQQIQVNEPVELINAKESITATAQQGQLDLAQQLVDLNQNVLVTGVDNDSRLTADSLRWNLQDQTLLAEGNVNYQQSNPQIVVKGSRARGRIQEQSVIVDGGRVITEIIPD